MVWNTYETRCLTDSDVESFRALRLEGLATDPEAFGSTATAEIIAPDEHFSRMIRSDAVFGAFKNGGLIGMAGFQRALYPMKIRHRGILWGVYVQRKERGTGIATALLNAVFARARAEVEQVHLHAVADNPRAVGFFTKMGFTQYGLIERAFKEGDHYHDQVMMMCQLSKDAGRRVSGERAPRLQLVG